MRLKSLKLAGFKSFANATTFTFPHGITAIVGPNGCGKSNVIDAIRWVLGETSAKQLRGGAMSDVIFAGTQDKAAKSVASVELTFEHTPRMSRPVFAMSLIYIKVIGTSTSQSRRTFRLLYQWHALSSP